MSQQTPALAVWKYDVCSNNWPNSANCPWRNGPPVAYVRRITLTC